MKKDLKREHIVIWMVSHDRSSLFKHDQFISRFDTSKKLLGNDLFLNLWDCYHDIDCNVHEDRRNSIVEEKSAFS